MARSSLARSSDTAAAPEAVVGQTDDDGSSYRCPGCGETVDNQRMADVMEHHQHVLQPSYPPAWFQQSVQAAQDKSGGQGKREPQSLRVLPDPVERSAEAHARRYGH